MLTLSSSSVFFCRIVVITQMSVRGSAAEMDRPGLAVKSFLCLAASDAVQPPVSNGFYWKSERVADASEIKCLAKIRCWTEAGSKFKGKGRK